MAGSSYLTPDVIAAETLFNLENNCVMANNVHRGYVKEFVKVGSNVRIKKPNKFISKSGRTRQNQDITEGFVNLTVDQQEHVSWAWSAIDLTLTIQEYSKEYAKPAGIALANVVDAYLAGLYYEFSISGGTPGTTPQSFAVLGDMATLLDDGAVPDDDERKMMLNPKAAWSMADALKGVFDKDMPREFMRKGILKTLAGFEIYKDQNIARHTTGSGTGDGVLVDEGTESDRNSNTSPRANTMAMNFDGFDADAASILKKGDVFTIAGVNSVNPVSKADSGNLMQFSVQSNFTSVSNQGDVTFAPAIVTTGPHQNCSAIPADSAVCTFLGAESTAYPQNLAFHRNALALAVVPIELPDSCSFKATASHNGIHIAVVKAFDIDTYEEIIRKDILFAAKAIYPELGSRLWG